MFLSIIIPIWNDEKYIRECLDSCLNQDLSPDEYEIICVDDGSTDSTREIIRGYADRFSNIRPLYLEHSGLAGRTVGQKMAKGDYIWFVDHDDFIAPHAVDTLYRITKEKPGYERYNFRFYEFYDELNEQERRLYQLGELHTNAPMFRYKVVWTFIIQREFLASKGIDARPTIIAEAKTFWGREDFPVFGGDAVFVQVCNDSGVKEYNLDDETLYFYRRSESSETTTRNLKAFKRRAYTRYNAALITAYVAFNLKNRYHDEKEITGAADTELTTATILRIRTAVWQLGDTNRKYQRCGIKDMQQKGIFFKKKPEEYVYRYRDYIKTRPLRQLLLPSTWLYYFTYKRIGASIFCVIYNTRNVIKYLIARSKVLYCLRKAWKKCALQRR